MRSILPACVLFSQKAKHVKKNEKKDDKTTRKIEKQKGLSADEKKAKKEKMVLPRFHATPPV